MNIFEEALNISMNIWIYAMEAEDSGAAGAAKKKAVMEKVIADLRSPEGLYVKWPVVLNLLERFLPRLIDMVVAKIKKTGAFS